MSMEWFSPDDVIADALFERGEACKAVLKNGDEVDLFFGELTMDDEGDIWTGFYDDDGEEVLRWDIERVRPLGASAHTPHDSKGGAA